ncbi:MAG TPA: cobyrinate a,c-diamide synthase [Bacillota bacterium]|nr:cobyrinate a,c-diamide synthase [Bacillota bacterium]
MASVPRVVIAGTHSGVGKTTIATGLMAALTARGLRVQGFKVGPDYIDPSYHTRATNRPSRNLDTWLLGEAGVRELFERNTRDCDIAVIEGVMGLYDGFGGTSELGSTAHVAKLLQAPVVLVVNAKSMSRSIAALIKGYCELDSQVPVKGVILNRVAGERHGQLLREAIAHNNSVSVVGELKADAVLPWPERHLGLVPMAEQGEADRMFEELSGVIGESISLTAILELARGAGEMPSVVPSIFTAPARFSQVRIGYAWDKAFNFYYQDSLDLLEHLGAELIRVSPLSDKALPPGLHGLYIGGGFPELYLPELAANQPFIKSLHTYGARGLPIFAECGGLMYLTQAIHDFNQNRYPMAGLIPGECHMQKRLAALGYYEGRTLVDNLLCSANTPIKGHEFHYSTLGELPEDFPWAYELSKGQPNTLRQEGFAGHNILAGYLHVHLAGNTTLARGFIDKCSLFKERG